MNLLYNEEEALLSLRSVYSLQSALVDYVNSVRTLLDAGFSILENQIITDSVHQIMRNINELLKLCNQKIEIFSQKYSETELYALYLEHQPKNEQLFPKCVKQLHDLANKCYCTNWKKLLISDEIQRFSLLFNHQKQLLNPSYRNDPNTIWLSKKVGSSHFFNDHLETNYLNGEFTDDYWEE